MHNRIFRAVGVAAAVMAVSGVPMSTAVAAQPQDLTCTGAHTGGRWADVTVPEGQTCTLTGTTVTGTITLDTNHNTLNLNRTTVRGGISTVHFTAINATATMTVRSSRVKGLIDVDYVRGTYYDSRLAGLDLGGFANSELTLNRSRVTGDVEANGRWSDTYLDHARIDGGLTVGFGGQEVIRASVVRGHTKIQGIDAQLCGSSFGATQMIAIYQRAASLGDGGKCRGNLIRGDLTVEGPVANFYRNTVTGHTTSPATQEEPVKGSGNRFRGGVTGVLAALK